jgi:hypothetical protein
MEGDPLEVFLVDHLKEVGAGEVLGILIEKDGKRVGQGISESVLGHGSISLGRCFRLLWHSDRMRSFESLFYGIGGDFATR